jgi:hypothetical protein
MRALGNDGPGGVVKFGGRVVNHPGIGISGIVDAGSFPFQVPGPQVQKPPGRTARAATRFSLNNSLSDVILSQNAKCVLESCHIPNITNLTTQIVYLRFVTSSQNKTYDTTKGLNGNPIILSTMVHTSTVQSNVIANASDMFYSLNIPSIFLNNGLIELELECPSATSSIDFITGLPLKTFYISLIIVDVDPELTKDLTLAPPIDYNNYNVNIPIRPY